MSLGLYCNKNQSFWLNHDDASHAEELLSPTEVILLLQPLIAVTGQGTEY